MKSIPIRRLLVSTLMVALIAVAAAASVAVRGVGSTHAAETITVYAGGGQGGIAVNEFRPDVFTIAVGDTVEFVNPYEELHTVTFLDGGETPELIVPSPDWDGSGPPKLIFNPEAAFPAPEGQPASYDGAGYANSGLLMKDQVWDVTFTEPGTYSFLCILHPTMVGVVNVGTSSDVVPSQAARDAVAAASLEAGIEAGETAAAAVVTSTSDNGDGSTTYEVQTGPAVGNVDVIRFLPETIKISAGDTVTWNNDTFVPHTVTFSSGEEAPGFVIPEPQEAGPPNLVINPDVLFPSEPRESYDGTGYVNSGFIGAGPESTAGSSFSLTFDKPGEYLYVCVLHLDQGMVGVVEVGQGITPPSTGDGGLLEEGSSMLLFLSLALIGALAVGAVAVSLRRRSGIAPQV